MTQVDNMLCIAMEFGNVPGQGSRVVPTASATDRSVASVDSRVMAYISFTASTGRVRVAMSEARPPAVHVSRINVTPVETAETARTPARIDMWVGTSGERS